MTKKRTLSDHTRQELYDLVWSTPALKLAADFGVSGVAVAKFCKRRNIPRPGRGYWAKIEAGQSPRKVPLPSTDNVCLLKAVERRVPKLLRLPENSVPLLPQASELMEALTKAKLEHYKRAELKDRSFPEVKVSKALAERVAKSFHVLLKECESLGVTFRKFQGIHSSGYFERGRERLYLTISESVVRPDGSTLQQEWQWPREKASVSGYLTFSLNTERYSHGNAAQWSESAKVCLESTLAHVVAGIQRHYLDIQKRREQEKIECAKRHAEWLIQRAEWEKQEAIRLKEESEQKQAAAIAAAVEAREKALLQAAINWRQSNALLEFIAACETRWKNQPVELTPEQIAWLTWANGIAVTMSPFASDYPDPTKDGAFDPSSTPRVV